MTVPTLHQPGSHKNMQRLALLVVILGFLAPLGMYRLICGGAPMITPEQAKQLLHAEDSQYVLVDVRPEVDFNDRHIDGSQNWPLSRILEIRSGEDIPGAFKDKKLLLLCNVGISAAKAARHLAPLASGRVFIIRGGLQEWIASAAGTSAGPLEQWRLADGRTAELPHRIAPKYEQIVAVASGMVIKPTYTLLSLILFIILWRYTAPDLTALRWAMLAFFVGENFCAINYYVFADTSYLSEYLHSFGMLLCFGLTTWAVLEGMDSRIFMLSDTDRRCAALGLCMRCSKHADVPCAFQRLFMFIIPACIVLAGMPLCADRCTDSWNTVIFGTPYNYTHRMAYQLFEMLYCPVTAVVLLAGSLVVMFTHRPDRVARAKVLFACGMGPLGFGLLRMMLVGPYCHNQVWFAFWEEVTELLFIVAVCVVLWLFRQGLFRGERHEP